MTKKKFYQQPQAKFIEVKQADIIATSTLNYSTTGFNEFDDEDLN